MGDLVYARYMHGIGVPFVNDNHLVSHDFTVVGGYWNNLYASEWCTINESDDTVTCVQNWSQSQKLEKYRLGLNRKCSRFI